MDPRRAAEIMVTAVARGQRDVVFPLDGTFKGLVLSRVLLVIIRFFPALGDRLVVASSRKMNAAAGAGGRNEGR